VSFPKKVGRRRDRIASLAGFVAPFLLALLASFAAPTSGLAQVSNPLSVLQQLQGNTGRSLGGIFSNTGIVDNTLPQAQGQTLQPAVGGLQNLLPSRLEQIVSSRAGMQLQQFGYDQLGLGREVTVPETGAVADDYVMGPGDEVVVSLRGQENTDVRVTVDRNGQVVLPRLAPIAASGRSFGAFRQTLDAAVSRAYVATKASVTLGRVRQVTVLVSGEVNVPGQRIATGLSSVVDALLLSGGVKKTGSLRNVNLVRAGKTYTVDLYGVLAGSVGVGSAGMRIADGDRIIVPPLGPTVAVAGLVRRAGIYELPAHSSGMSARALLALAGGQEVRGRYRLAVQRIEADGRLALVSLQNDNSLVRDSEILRVELAADLTASQATLSGGTGLAGQYAISTGTKLSEVIRSPGALGPSPYTLFGLIVRKDPKTLLRSLVAFTPVAVLNGTEDQALQSDDLIRPLSQSEAALLSFVVKTFLDKLTVDQARIRNPLEAQQRADVQAAAASAPAGASPAIAAALQAQGLSPNGVSPENPFGLQPGALDASSTGQEDFSSVPADLQRSNIIALLDIPAPGSLLAQQRQLATQQGGQQAQQAQQAASNLLAANALRAGGQAGLFPTDIGANQAPGQVSTGQDYNLPQNYQEQALRTGEFASNREVRTFGELARQLNLDPLVLVNFLIDHRARLDGAVMGPGFYFVGPNVSLKDLVQAAGGTASGADESSVELLTTVVDTTNGRAASQRQSLPLRQGLLASYVVRPRDQLHFHKVFTDTGIGSVTVQGEVRFAGNYPIRRGEHLSDLLMRAGGLTSTAYPQGTVFLRKSAAQIEQSGYQRAANDIESQLLAGVTNIGSNRVDPAAVHAFATQLRTQRALGRIAIVADPSVLAANPRLDPLLEGGDVVFIPQRPSTVAVLGEVMQPGSYTYQGGMTVKEYIKKAGGYAQFAEDDMTFIVQPDGSARKVEESWLSADVTTIPPGSAIVVPRNLAPLDLRQLALDVTSILSSFAVTAASLAVLAKQ
jgi:protein involved in polysaccharide export with SLBB domain